MTNEKNSVHVPGVCEETQTLLRSFFNRTNANELSETFTLLLDAYVQHGEFDRLKLAGTISLINDLQRLAFNLENLQTRKADVTLIRRQSEFQS